MSAGSVYAENWAPIKASKTAERSFNPIRNVVETIRMPGPEAEKELIPLSLGDPTVFGNLKTPEFLLKQLQENLWSYKHNGYVNSTGSKEARDAVAARYSTDASPLTSDDVILTSGCSGALDMAITVLADEGDSLLVPQPGFPLYETLAASKGINVDKYNLLPDKAWEADLEHMESLINEKTKAIVVNNPSNPCGSVYSEKHLRDILEIANRHRVPIIADEIYGNIVFEGSKFYPLASLTDRVPVLATGGIAKEFLVPGWRLGWVLVHNRNGVFDEIRNGLAKLSQLVLGPNSLIQSGLPTLLNPLSGSAEEKALQKFENDLVGELQSNAEFVSAKIRDIDGMEVIVPQGAMYVMVRIDTSKFDVENDVEFTQKLLDEESVFVLPGKCFGMENFIRIVFSPPEEKLATACGRIEEFCKRHLKN